MEANGNSHENHLKSMETNGNQLEIIGTVWRSIDVHGETYRNQLKYIEINRNQLDHDCGITGNL